MRGLASREIYVRCVLSQDAPWCPVGSSGILVSNGVSISYVQFVSMNSIGSNKFLANVSMVSIGYNKLPASSSMIVNGSNQLLGSLPMSSIGFNQLLAGFYSVLCKGSLNVRLIANCVCSWRPPGKTYLAGCAEATMNVPIFVMLLPACLTFVDQYCDYIAIF